MSALQSLRWIALQNLVTSITYIKRSPWLSSVDQPDEIKTYPGNEHLYASRIFKPASQTGALPLVFRLHGGGFIMNNPAVDDHLARRIADEAGCVVVSLDYSKSPRKVFPSAYEDVVRLCLAAISDSTLQIDHKKIYLCGTSAGGNLALGVAQDVRLRPKLAGVLGIAPLVDLSTRMEIKMSRRPDPSVPDFLEDSYDNMLNLYVANPALDLADPRLSPDRFKDRKDLPEQIYLISIEHDLLSKEAELMAEKLAGNASRQQVEGGWQAGTVRWTRVANQQHAFSTFADKDPAREAARLLTLESTERDIVSWFKAAFAAA